MLLHGDHKTRFYKIYQTIKDRCYNKNRKEYKNYGGKGILCERKTYENFKKDMYDSYIKHCNEYGEKDTTIDRIDNDKNYCKENCRWATMQEQVNNRKCVYKFTKGGNTYNSLKEFCRENNINYVTISTRIRRGWSLEKAISNTKSIYTIEYNGIEYKSIMDLCKKLGISYDLVSTRTGRGWDIKKAVETPKKIANIS